MKSTIRIGTRGSQLAMYQAELVKTKIEIAFSLITVKIVKIKTGGDMVRRGGASPLETKRMYTREIEDALLRHEIDIAVHSAKDMSVDPPEGLEIAAALEREDARDCLVSQDKKKLSELPLGARIGTSSLRRKMQLLRCSPELIVEEMHGNVDTRIRKIMEGQYDAIVLAYAGMKRLGLENYVTEIFPEDQFYPSPGQGIIAVQARSQDSEIHEAVRTLNHQPTAKRLDCEQAFLRRLEGGCKLPCGISTSLEKGQMSAKGGLFSIEDRLWAESELEGSIDKPRELGRDLADAILANGGQKILDKIRNTSGKKK